MWLATGDGHMHALRDTIARVGAAVEASDIAAERAGMLADARCCHRGLSLDRIPRAAPICEVAAVTCRCPDARKDDGGYRGSWVWAYQLDVATIVVAATNLVLRDPVAVRRDRRGPVRVPTQNGLAGAGASQCL